MTISTTDLTASYSGNGVTTAFAFPYRFLADADLVITLISAAGIETLQTLTTDYTVIGAGDDAGGTVTMVTAPASGETLFLRRTLALTQEVDYITGETFPAETHEQALDRLTMISQQLTEAVNRALSLSDTTEGITAVLPSPEAFKILGWNSAADAIANYQEIGTYKGTDATTTTVAYVERDLVKSTTAGQLDNVYICIQDAPLGTLLTNTSFFALIVDAVSAATSATNAAASESAAALSESNASTSEANSAASAAAALASEGAASTSASNASTSETNAAASEAAAAASYDAFDDRYLGSKASDPTLDNDGNALLTGALYWNTSSNQLFVWTGSAWTESSFSTLGTLQSSNNLSDLDSASTARTNLGLGSLAVLDGVSGLFSKDDSTIVAFTKTGAGTAQTATGMTLEVNGLLLTIASGTSITMPTLTAGTDYAIWAETAGTLQASANHTTPPSANARKIGGFHYASGGNATGTSGGDTTPAINEYSFWDLKFRPACPDPRGMTLVDNSFWADIYLCGVDHTANGTSAYNVTIADGSSPPKVPLGFGGNGTTAYANGNWWNFAEVMRSHGKRLPTYSEFAALAYGTTEATSRGTDPITTQMSTTDDNFTSKWGVIQASGCLWTWGDEFGGGAAAASWTANTDGRGSTYQMENAALFGGAWSSGSFSGSRCSFWNYSPTFSDSGLSVRAVCDHLSLD